MNWTAMWWAMGGGFVTLVVLVLAIYRPSQIRRDRAMRFERRGVTAAPRGSARERPDEVSG